MQYVFLIIMGNMAVCIISFWNVFGVDILIDECHPRYDCFPLHAANLSAIKMLPIDSGDCDDYISNGNDVTVICFQLAFKYSEGLGEAGGLLFVIQVVTNVLIYFSVRTVQVALWLYNSRCSSHANSCYKTVIPFAISITLSVLVTGTFLVLSVLFPQRILYDRPEFVTTQDTPNRRLETSIYYLTLAFLSLTPLVFGIGIKFDAIINSTEKYKGVTEDMATKDKAAGKKPPESSTNATSTELNHVDNSSTLF